MLKIYKVYFHAHQFQSFQNIKLNCWLNCEKLQPLYFGLKKTGNLLGNPRSANTTYIKFSKFNFPAISRTLSTFARPPFYRFSGRLKSFSLKLGTPTADRFRAWTNQTREFSQFFHRKIRNSCKFPFGAFTSRVVGDQRSCKTPKR